MLVRQLSDGKLFNGIFDGKESFTWLLDTDVASLCAKRIIADYQNFFI